MSKATKRLYLKFGIFAAVVLFLTIAPVSMSLWDKAYPFILGWPLAQFCVFASAVLMILALNTVFRVEGKLVKRETEMRKRGEKIDY